MKVTVTNTAGILYLVDDASGQNRSVYDKKFENAVDPDGMHLLAMHMPHKDMEGRETVRTQWFCKMKDSLSPSEIWLDVSHSALEACTSDIEVDDNNLEDEDID
ncbi:hypothetical protein OAA09_01280 [bacterium]|nr:hypothetical protein [bacterium]